MFCHILLCRLAILRSAWWLGLLAVCLAELGLSTARGDLVYLLPGNDEALEARRLAIQEAIQEIDAAYYTIDDGQVPLAFLAELRDAASRGVQVRLLVDGLKNKIPLPVERCLAAHGVQIREYHPILLRRLDWLNSRMHDKLLVVDRAHLIVGSRNMQDHHFGRACVNYVDRDVYVYGCAAAEAQWYFQRRWNSNEVRPVHLEDRRLQETKTRSKAAECGVQIDWTCCSPQCACQVLDAMRQRVPMSAEELPVPTEAVDEEFLRSVPVRFLCDPPDASKHASVGIERDVIALFDGARSEIIVETPYLVLSAEMRRVLLAARARGVVVRILTNSLASTDEKMAQAAYENQKRQLLNAEVDLWEFAGPDHLHAKSAVVDGRFAMIGSYNFDARSEKVNSEIAILVDDPLGATLLAASIADHSRNAYKIGHDGKPLGSDVKYPGVEPSRVRQSQLRRLIAPVLRRCL